MWARCTVGQQWADGSSKGEASRHSWQAAQELAAATNNNGSLFFSDWRLPLLRELATIAERQCSNPRINLTVFPNTPSAAYWSVTLRPGSTTSDAAFALSFGADGIEHQSMDQQHHVRLVRSAR